MNHVNYSDIENDDDAPDRWPGGPFAGYVLLIAAGMIMVTIAVCIWSIDHTTGAILGHFIELISQ